MKKILLGLLAVVVLAVLGVLGAAMTQPDTIHIERSTTVSATAADVFPYADDFKLFTSWIPWTELDPSQTVAYSDPTSGVGAWYTWEGNNQVGKGKMSHVSAEPTKVVHQLEFIEPFASTASSSITMVDQADGKVKVTWAYDQDAGMMDKVMGLFMDMDAMIGADFEKGLAKLGPMVETAAAARIAAEQKAAEEAALAAAAAAAEEEAAAAAEAPVDGPRVLSPTGTPPRALGRPGGR